MVAISREISLFDLFLSAVLARNLSDSEGFDSRLVTFKHIDLIDSEGFDYQASHS